MSAGRIKQKWAELDLRNMNRPSLTWEWWDDDEFAIGLSWGYPGGDAVWSFGISFSPPRFGRKDAS